MAKVYTNDSKRSSGAGTVGIVVGSIVLLAVILVIVLVACCFVSVPTGHTGIVTTFGKVEDYTYEAGIHVKAPWQAVVKMDNRNQKSTCDLSCFSSDIQEIAIVYSINYQIEKTNAQTIYKTIGVNYYETVMLPRIQTAVKKYTANYTAEELIENRAELQTAIQDELVLILAKDNIEVLSTSIENIDFNDAFTDAVEQKQVAAQNMLQKEIEEKQAIMVAESAAKRAVIDATAAADTAKIKAESDAAVVKIQADSAEYQGQKDAAVNKAIAQSLTPELIRYYYITYWDGKLPETYVSSDDFLSLLDIKAGGTASDTDN